MKDDKNKGALEALTRLTQVIAARAGSRDAGSYTVKLLQNAPLLPAKKLAEEAVELALAAVSQDKAAVTSEAADVLYHLLVLLQSAGVSLDEVCRLLSAREGVSGLEEKAGRDK